MKKIEIISKSNTYYSLVDDKYYEEVSKWKWCLHNQGYAYKNYREFNYTYNTKAKQGSILLHQFIWFLEYDKAFLGNKGLTIDHINKNKLDNQVSNLRLLNRSNQRINCDIRSNNTSGHVGITWNKRANTWQATIGKKGEKIYLGNFKHLNDAVKARLKAEKELHNLPH